MKKTIMVANTLLANNEEQILLLRRSSLMMNALQWSLPGGLVELNEEPSVAAWRELEEETGIGTYDLIIKKMVQFILELPHENIHMYTAYAKYVGRDDGVTLSEEHIDYMWLPVRNIYNLPNVIEGLPTIVACVMGLPARVDITIPPGAKVNMIK